MRPFQFFCGIFLLVGVSFLFFLVSYNAIKQEQGIKNTEAKVRFWAERLDEFTFDSGHYIEYNGKQSGVLPELDAWDSPLHYTYSKNGIIDMVIVTSYGPDRKSSTGDDISVIRSSMINEVKNESP